MIEERKNINMNVNTNIIQNLVLENRKKLSVSGVNDVLSFDDQVVMIDTELGRSEEHTSELQSQR